MGHNTNALIGKMSINLEKIKFYGLAVAFENDYAIIFLDESHLFHWYFKLKLDYHSDNEKLELGGELVHFFAKEIGLEEYLLVHLSHYYYAELYKNTIRTDEGEINLMLRKIGVEVIDKRNEFDELNLNEYRMPECFYWEGDANWAKLYKNIIGGYINK